jgi:ABC-type molybdenum transport system ATPase subunit/photorepair protein PhrA
MLAFGYASVPLIDVVNGAINFASGSASERVQVISGINWRVERGQVWAVLGGNGTGKSSLGRLFTLPAVCRAAPPGEGSQGEELRMFGHDRGTDSAERARRHSIGGVSTEVHMAWVNACRSGEAHSEYSVRDVIGHRLKHELLVDTSMCEDEGAAAVEAAASLLRVSQLLDRRFNALSQGEQKLVVVAAAIAHGPELLLVDEVGQGLDLHRRAHLSTLLRALVLPPPSSEEAPVVRSLVVITHHADEIPRGVTHALLLGKGEVGFCGEANQLDAVGLLSS